MFKSIFAKILVITSMIIVLSIMVSSGFSYWHFNKFMTIATIESDLDTLSQHAIHLNDFAQTVNGIANNIVISPEIQNFCRQHGTSHSYLELWDTMEPVRQAITGNKELHSAVLVVDGVPYWSNYPTDPYFQDRTQEPWFLAATASTRHFEFGTPYVFCSSRRKYTQMIPYTMMIFDINQPSQKLGLLILNIYADSVYGQTREWSESFDRYALYNDAGALYCSDPDFAESVEELGLDFRSASHGYYKSADGVHVWKQSDKSGWTLLGFTSKQKIRQRLGYVVWFAILFAPIAIAAALLLLSSVLYQITQPIARLTQAMLGFSKGDHQVHLDIHTGDELETLSITFNEMVQSINSYIEEKLRDEKLKRKMKFDLLISKIYPHFIYNSLNSIVFLARKNGNTDIVEMTQAIILILQDSMAIHKNQVFDTVSRELQVIRAYCAIQSYRYREQFRVEYHIAPTVYEQTIPKNILQPLVENCLFHGIAPMDTPGVITITIAQTDGALHITVSDNGVGISPEKMQELLSGKPTDRHGHTDTVHSIGFADIRERLNYLYPNAHLLEMTSSPGNGTSTHIMLKPVAREELPYEALG
ncbi:MAG: histidine kinase [Angelakisella sp.]